MCKRKRKSNLKTRFCRLFATFIEFCAEFKFFFVFERCTRTTHIHLQETQCHHICSSFSLKCISYCACIAVECEVILCIFGYNIILQQRTIIKYAYLKKYEPNAPNLIFVDERINREKTYRNRINGANHSRSSIL